MPQRRFGRPSGPIGFRGLAMTACSDIKHVVDVLHLSTPSQVKIIVHRALGRQIPGQSIPLAAVEST
jgi:hypothetical protein